MTSASARYRRGDRRCLGAIVASLVADIIMPIIGAITGGLDFSNYLTSPLSSKVDAGLAYADAKK